MAFKHYDLTMNGSAQNLSTVFANPTRSSPEDVPCRTIFLQADGANAAAIYVGDTSSVSSSVHAIRINAPVGGIPSAPLILGEFSNAGAYRLSDFWIVGANNEKLHIGLTPF